MKLLLGDCADILKGFDDNSIDAIVSDPPYGLAFMGKDWDKALPPKEVWEECLRVLKPGGYIVAMSGSRTYHRLAVDLEDIGFKTHPMIGWIYGSGFPKATDLSKQFDKQAGVERCVIEERFKNGDMRGAQNFGNRDQSGKKVQCNITAPATDLAKKWDGFKYGLQALKPALEPIYVGQKPIDGKRMTDNVVKHGVGAMNIEACRVQGGMNDTAETWARKGAGGKVSEHYKQISASTKQAYADGKMKLPSGRHPANLLHNGSESVEAVFLEQGGILKTGGPKYKDSHKDGHLFEGGLPDSHRPNNSGTASRFFNSLPYSEDDVPFLYCAKASKRERNHNCEGVITWESVDLNQDLMVLSQLVRDISENTMQFIDEQEWSTELYGLSISEQFPKTMIFTISTVIKLITKLKTLSASPNLNTRESTLDAIRMIQANGGSLAESVAKLEQYQLDTTSEKMASVLGVSLVVLKTLLKIKEKGKHGNVHSTVKPQKLMSWLIKLVTPPGGTVLDPFMGSGSTGLAARNNGFGFVGIEREPEYYEIAKKE